jgi:colanic acid/amylovoran biosynthesis glycosyltransferase
VLVELIGDGELRDVIEGEIAAFGLQDNVRIRGWLPNEQVRDEVAGAAALLLPTLAEGLPIVIMEALALGRPVVTTRVAGIPELVDAGCGWVVEPGSVEQLIDALRAMLATTQAQRAALGAEGRRRVAANHDVHRSARMLLDAFRQRGSLR